MYQVKSFYQTTIFCVGGPGIWQANVVSERGKNKFKNLYAPRKLTFFSVVVAWFRMKRTHEYEVLFSDLFTTDFFFHSFTQLTMH
jgi:hypothetical protein